MSATIWKYDSNKGNMIEHKYKDLFWEALDTAKTSYNIDTRNKYLFQAIALGLAWIAEEIDEWKEDSET